MYKNLKKAMNDLNITSKEMSKHLALSEKVFSCRLSGKVKFKDYDKEDIYKYLKKNGYTGSIKKLFIFSFPIDKPKKETRLSSIINKGMKELNLSNQDVINKLQINKNTISGWKNGTIETLNYENILPLAKLLDVYPMYLMGDDRYKGFKYNDGFFIEETTIKNYYSHLYDLLTKIILIDDSKYKLIKDKLSSTEQKQLFINKIFDEEIYPKIKPIFDKYFIDNNKEIHHKNGEIKWHN